MKTKNILVLLAAITLIVSCQKEDEEPTIVKVYEQYSIERLPDRAFTKDGEITDTSLLNSFFRNHSFHSNNNFVYLNNSYVVVYYPIRIEYLANNQVNFYKDNRKTQRKIIAENGVIYFESQEKIGFYNYKEGDYYKLTKYKPYWMVSSSINDDSGVGEVTSFKHCYFATENGDDLILPFFAYFIVRYNPDDPYYRFIEWNEPLNNSFGGISENYLGDGDTLAIRESRTTLRRK